MKNLINKTKNNVNQFLLRFGYELRALDNYRPLPRLLKRLNSSSAYFLQIGANDGVSFDPIYESVVAYGLSGVCVEPIPEYYEELVKNYSKSKNVKTINAAVTADNSIKNFELYKVKNVKRDWEKGLASFDINRLIAAGVQVDNIEKCSAPVIFIRELVERIDRDIDLLVIDCEGYDAEILLNFPFDKTRPKIIHFEHQLYQNSSTADRNFEALNFLLNLKYKISIDQQDCTAYDI